ncbi:MAG TPA: tetratricopeptide repeat protein, partial [Vicinamibacteria bacterium]|nr:tetratricopeptide repeat protein [Vicinamibacteria bacterium]
MHFLLLVFLTALITQGSESQDLYVAARAELIDEKYERALELFSQVVSRYPTSDEADDAQFYVGYALEHLGRQQEAIAAFSAVIERWPESSRAESARARRAQLAAAVAPAGGT